MHTHGIKVAVMVTGLSDHVLRVWEKRYGAVTPKRTETNRRLYSDADIARLQTLATLVEKGYAISQIAKLKDADLHDLLGSVASSNERRELERNTDQSKQFIQQAVSAIRQYDQKRLESIFDEASLRLGYSGLLELVIIPVMQHVGDDWANGRLTSAGEHAATSFVKEYLAHSVRSFAIEEHAPVLVATTPAGQMHELGAFIGSCLARKNGWKIVYLGPSLPADEIAGAVIEAKADALLLSIVYPIDDPKMDSQLIRLRKQLPEQTPILVGGSQVANYERSLTDIQATHIPTLSGLQAELQKIRESRLV
ncbi:MerR family transcriptional regulator [Verrucomicrobiaceae bacterium N1E253]|uniref:MerR family transcriptional regulator n=1 Tax=Oceaniferula marina TaxID=2748318 RepID=A0A851GQ51_9BACT|nr:MerR family transcriptional regulator [Oceaniferula marina]NWK57127.1 MerR family transcriptional regulator [Oceaniferula marina]